MRPLDGASARFTLDLSTQGIRLFYDLNGIPTVLGDVSPTAPNLDRRMLNLRMKALQLSAPPIRTNIFVSADNVLFRTAQSEIVSEKLQKVLEEDVQQEAMARTERQDPKDICVVSLRVGSRYFVAAIEHDVLRAACRFARQHGFEPAVLTTHTRRELFPKPLIFPGPATGVLHGKEQGSPRAQDRAAESHGNMIVQINDLQSTIAGLQAEIQNTCED